MPTTAPTSRSGARRFVWLAVAIVAAGLAWTVAWHVVATRIEDETPRTLRKLAAGGQAECAGAEVRGYPFRFGLFCDRLTYHDPSAQISADTGALRSAAQFYRPGHIVSEADAPLVFSAPGVSGRVDWQGLQTSIHASPAGIGRGSLDGRQMQIEIDTAGPVAFEASRLSLSVERLRAHLRRNGPDLDIAAYADVVDANLSAGLAAKSVVLEATVPDHAVVLDTPFALPVGAYGVQLHRMALELDEASSLELSGPVTVAANGLVSGRLDLTLRNPEQLNAIAAAFDPEAGKMIARVTPMLTALDTVPGDEAITLPLTLRDGAVSLGFVPLGRIPPL